MPFTDENLTELLECIAGQGRWAWTGGAGFHTHPGYDANQQSLHDACCELERRGLVERVHDTPTHRCFVAKKQV